MNKTTAQFDPVLLRADFPILQQTIHRNRQLVYLDNGASTQHPRPVIQSMVDCYERNYANVHRGIHWLSEQATALYEQARTGTQQFVGAQYPEEIIFTSGTTAAINCVSQAWGHANINAGDEILLTILEHHSNIVPWQQLAAQVGARVRFVGLTEEGHLDLNDFEKQLNEKTRIVGISAVSNVLGTNLPVAELAAKAHSAGAKVLVDAAQHVPHEPTRVQDWGADWVVFSGHKMLGPSGIGVLYGRRDLLEQMPPFLGGGSMISTVTTEGFTPGELPAKFEAGTPPIAQAIGLHAAIEYLNGVGLNEICQHEHRLTELCCHKLAEIDGLKILGPLPPDRAGIVSFVVDGVSPQDISIFLDRAGVAIRAGHHCTMPLHDYLGIRNSCRASFYLYNTADEVEIFVESLKAVITKLR